MTVAEVKLDPLLETFARAVAEAIDAVVPVAEAFVIGSAATGSFRAETSDLDLVAVVERPLGRDRHEVMRGLRALQPPVDLELVLYVTGSQPPAFELNVNEGEERPDEERFWFVLDAALAQETAVSVLRGRQWSSFFEPIGEERTRAAMQESLEWAERRPATDGFARRHVIRARHYLEHGEWITKEEARR